MVNIDLIELIKKDFIKNIGEDKIRFLVVGGSQARGNWVPEWSDVDLLFIPTRIDWQMLRLIQETEDSLRGKTDVTIDVMVTGPEDLTEENPSAIQDKVRNFFFFLGEAQVLICNGPVPTNVGYKEFKHGVEVVCAEQQKKFLRRNIDVNTENLGAMQNLFRKNIKIIFLVLKRAISNEASQPTNYADVVKGVELSMPDVDCKVLERYIGHRVNNGITSLSLQEVTEEIDKSVSLFRQIVEITLRNKEMWI